MVKGTEYGATFRIDEMTTPVIILSSGIRTIEKL